MRTVIAAAAVLLFASLAFAKDETHFYDAKGHYRGRATTNTANPRQKSLYDSRGNYLGRVMTLPDGTERVYDSKGNYQGSGGGHIKQNGEQRNGR
ncbi:hypothetical protein DFW101_3517 [Solidesulfovibrio carbinoliphilus subsp. oakridgensis]|uniref:YD repeat protein n=1 Tax=Solidesulfovibrio carbinoliphilus subsp. oakridgensis TaxID=694327 RepID=G7QC67_9BACT|nr:hypothetical protein [Solidesulfovibrio carbinoliphilus]EHJ49513.1 hypothetical protein DFW101_3517 [Solidesulfovibrio carbinoliphilus subsp. oakridgensis]